MTTTDQIIIAIRRASSDQYDEPRIEMKRARNGFRLAKSSPSAKSRAKSRASRKARRRNRS